jgi:anti-sigma B factor antagonist
VPLLRTQIDFHLTVAQLSSTAHVASISGELDMHTESDLRERLSPLASVAGATVIVDLSDVPFVDSTAVGVLAGLAKQLREQHGQLILASDDPRLRKLLELTGLVQILHVEPSLARAVETGVGAAAV